MMAKYEDLSERLDTIERELRSYWYVVSESPAIRSELIDALRLEADKLRAELREKGRKNDRLNLRLGEALSCSLRAEAGVVQAAENQRALLALHLIFPKGTRIRVRYHNEAGQWMTHEGPVLGYEGRGHPILMFLGEDGQRHDVYFAYILTAEVVVDD